VKNRGFSLLEVILSLAILGGAIAVLGEAARLALRNAEFTRDMARAQLLCIVCVEMWRNFILHRRGAGGGSSDTARAGRHVDRVERRSRRSAGGIVENDLCLLVCVLERQEVFRSKAVIEESVAGAKNGLGFLALSTIQRKSEFRARRPVVVIGNMVLRLPTQSA